MQVRRFMEPTLARLTASVATAGGSGHPKPCPQINSKPRSAPAAFPDVVDLEDDANDDTDPPIPRPRKRPRAEMEEDLHNYHSPTQFGRSHKGSDAPPSRPSVYTESHKANPRRTPRPSPRSSSQPLRVAPIQSRSPSPERAAILGPQTPIPHTPVATSAPPAPPRANSSVEHEVAARLRKERQAFYIKSASAARAEVKMDMVKPALRPPIQTPGLFHLLLCGLFQFDLQCDSWTSFEEEVTNWRNDPHCMDRLCAAYGRFYLPQHQVQHLHMPHLFLRHSV